MTLLPIDRIAGLLNSAGYKPLPTPVQIGDLKFDFPAAFVGTDSSADLILVADTTIDPEDRILRKAISLARALDIAQSKRSITMILAGPRPRDSTIEAMARVCRVLPVGPVIDESPDTSLRNLLAVLLPLKLPEPREALADPLTEIARSTAELPLEVRALVEKARDGTNAVQTELHRLIESKLVGTDEEQET